MHVFLLETDQSLQYQLDFAEVEISKKELKVATTTGLRKKAEVYHYRKYVNQEVSGLNADDFLFPCQGIKII